MILWPHVWELGAESRVFAAIYHDACSKRVFRDTQLQRHVPNATLQTHFSSWHFMNAVESHELSRVDCAVPCHEANV
jgi:hypothetical protein